MRRAREPWPFDFAGRRAREGAAFGALLQITGAHAFTFNDPDAADGVTTTWLEGGDPAEQWPKGCDGPQVLARTLDLVEPGDGECVLPARATPLLTIPPSLATLTPANHG